MSLQQAQTTCDNAQAQVDACNAALEDASTLLLTVYQAAFGKTVDDRDAFITNTIVQSTDPASLQLTVPAERQYRDAYVALQEAKDELQAAQTTLAQLSGNQNATNADVIQAVEQLFQFVNEKFGEMEARMAVLDEKVTAVDEKVTAVDARVAKVEVKANSAKGVTVAEVKSACKAGVKELRFKWGSYGDGSGGGIYNPSD